ncbi:hypothetical protein [[Eubacterium] cellulosolvens]
MAVDNTGVIDATQCTIVLLKFPKDALKDVVPEKIIELLSAGKLDMTMESPVSGFSELKYSRIGSRDEILIEYLIESPTIQTSVALSETGELTWNKQIIFIPKLLTAHIRPYSGLIELFTSDKRFVNRLVAEIRDRLKPVCELDVEKVIFSEEVLEHLLSKNEELLRVKFDHLDHTYIKEITLKGDLLDASEEYKHFRTQKNGKLGEFHIKFFSHTGNQLSLVINRFGSLRFFRTATELTWDTVEELIDELVPMVNN